MNTKELLWNMLSSEEVDFVKFWTYFTTKVAVCRYGCNAEEDSRR